MELPKIPKLPLGKLLAELIDWLNNYAAFIFDYISIFLGIILEYSINALIIIPPILLILIVTIFTWWLHRNWKLCLLCLLSLFLIINLGYWKETIETFILTFYATFFCMLIGVPVGIACSHRPRFFAIVRPILDLMQTIPTFVYLIPTLVLFGLGMVPGLISTIIFALAAPVRLTCLGINGVPDNLRDAGLSFGCSPQQLLWKIELPYALPTIMAGLTQCIMLSLSMVVIAALVGADGLGKPVVRALNTVNIVKGFEAGLVIVIIAILLDRILKTPKKRKNIANVHSS